MTTPRPDETPAHLIAEADQLAALDAELGEHSLELVVTALAEAALDGDDGTEGLDSAS